MIYAAKNKVIDAYFGDKKVLKMMLGGVEVYASSLPSYQVDCTFDGVTSDAPSSVEVGGPLFVTLSGTSGKQVMPWTVVVMMGETDVTSSAYDPSDNTISIASVTDDVAITASGVTMSSAYKPVEYIQNLSPAAGKRFVTDYYPTDTTEVIADVNVMALTNYSGVFGTMTSSTPYFALMARYTGSYGRGWWGNKALETSAFGTYLAISTRQTVTMGKGSLSYLPNGGDAYRTLTFDSTVTTPWTSPNVLQIGGYISGGTTFRGIQLRIYGLQIKEGNTIVRNYVPCQRISDNHVGLYDTINNAFLGQYDGNSDWTIPT